MIQHYRLGKLINKVNTKSRNSPSYYKSYIEDWQKEWSIEHRKYSAKKYKEKILDVSSELDNLILTFCKP